MAALALCTACASTPVAPPAREVSPPVTDSGAASLLRSTWLSYTRTFIQDGRVIDPRSDSNTTSEGQSYALLRAVWMNDRTTFDTVWTWTRAHLWDQASRRLGWLWGASSGALLSHDSASDGDEDIALALVFGAHRWQDSSYMQAAQEVLDGIWSNDVATLDGTPYLVAGSWAAQGDPHGPVVDPSYFAPYAYRIFAAVDGSHPWLSLVGSSYAALNACSQAALGAARSAGLPPNWCVLERGSGRALPFGQKADGDDYGYDAFRVMWRVALDGEWFGSAAARAYLAGQSFLRTEWQQQHRLLAVYGHDGSPRSTYDDPTVYGGDAGAFIGDRGAAAGILAKLLGSRGGGADGPHWGQPDNYYEQNWVWFGIALLTGRLTNLAAGG
jgi:endoglucanase